MKASQQPQPVALVGFLSLPPRSHEPDNVDCPPAVWADEEGQGLIDLSKHSPDPAPRAPHVEDRGRSMMSPARSKSMRSDSPKEITRTPEKAMPAGGTARKSATPLLRLPLESSKRSPSPTGARNSTSSASPEVKITAPDVTAQDVGDLGTGGSPAETTKSTLPSRSNTVLESTVIPEDTAAAPLPSLAAAAVEENKSESEESVRAFPHRRSLRRKTRTVRVVQSDDEVASASDSAGSESSSERSGNFFDDEAEESPPHFADDDEFPSDCDKPRKSDSNESLEEVGGFFDSEAEESPGDDEHSESGVSESEELPLQEDADFINDDDEDDADSSSMDEGNYVHSRRRRFPVLDSPEHGTNFPDTQLSGGKFQAPEERHSHDSRATRYEDDTAHFHQAGSDEAQRHIDACVRAANEAYSDNGKSHLESTSGPVAAGSDMGACSEATEAGLRVPEGEESEKPNSAQPSAREVEPAEGERDNSRGARYDGTAHSQQAGLGEAQSHLDASGRAANQASSEGRQNQLQSTSGSVAAGRDLEACIEAAKAGLQTQEAEDGGKHRAGQPSDGIVGSSEEGQINDSRVETETDQAQSDDDQGHPDASVRAANIASSEHLVGQLQSTYGSVAADKDMDICKEATEAGLQTQGEEEGKTPSAVQASGGDVERAEKGQSNADGGAGYKDSTDHTHQAGPVGAQRLVDPSVRAANEASSDDGQNHLHSLSGLGAPDRDMETRSEATGAGLQTQEEEDREKPVAETEDQKIETANRSPQAVDELGQVGRLINRLLTSGAISVEEASLLRSNRGDVHAGPEPTDGSQLTCCAVKDCTIVWDVPEEPVSHSPEMPRGQTNIFCETYHIDKASKERKKKKSDKGHGRLDECGSYPGTDGASGVQNKPATEVDGLSKFYKPKPIKEEREKNRARSTVNVTGHELQEADPLELNVVLEAKGIWSAAPPAAASLLSEQTMAMKENAVVAQVDKSQWQKQEKQRDKKGRRQRKGEGNIEGAQSLPPLLHLDVAPCTSSVEILDLPGTSPLLNAIVDQELVEQVSKEGIGPRAEPAGSSSGTRTKRFLLVLDLNNFLFHQHYRGSCNRCLQSSGQPNDPCAPMNVGMKQIHPHPDAISFLQFCLSHFAVGIWSCAKRHNVNKYLGAVVPPALKNQLLLYWDQEFCTTTDNMIPNDVTSSFGFKDPEKPEFLKELSKVWEKFPQFGRERTLLLDDSPYKARLNPVGTAVFPPPYTDMTQGEDMHYLSHVLQLWLSELAEWPGKVEDFVAQTPLPGGQPPYNPDVQVSKEGDKAELVSEQTMVMKEDTVAAQVGESRRRKQEKKRKKKGLTELQLKSASFQGPPCFQLEKEPSDTGELTGREVELSTPKVQALELEFNEGAPGPIRGGKKRTKKKKILAEEVEQQQVEVGANENSGYPSERPESELPELQQVVETAASLENQKEFVEILQEESPIMGLLVRKRKWRREHDDGEVSLMREQLCVEKHPKRKKKGKSSQEHVTAIQPSVTETEVSVHVRGNQLTELNAAPAETELSHDNTDRQEKKRRHSKASRAQVSVDLKDDSPFTLYEAPYEHSLKRRRRKGEENIEGAQSLPLLVLEEQKCRGVEVNEEPEQVITGTKTRKSNRRRKSTQAEQKQLVESVEVSRRQSKASRAQVSEDDALLTASEAPPKQSLKRKRRKGDDNNECAESLPLADLEEHKCLGEQVNEKPEQVFAGTKTRKSKRRRRSEQAEDKELEKEPKQLQNVEPVEVPRFDSSPNQLAMKQEQVPTQEILNHVASGPSSTETQKLRKKKSQENGEPAKSDLGGANTESHKLRKKKSQKNGEPAKSDLGGANKSGNGNEPQQDGIASLWKRHLEPSPVNSANRKAKKKKPEVEKTAINANDGESRWGDVWEMYVAVTPEKPRHSDGTEKKGASGEKKLKVVKALVGPVEPTCTTSTPKKKKKKKKRISC